jgi:hypothetical protein
MSIKFNIQETVESELFYGSYVIYILGGHHIKTNPDFSINITNIETNEIVELSEFFLKPRNYKFGKNAVRYYSFQINNYGKFKISVHNYDDIVVQDSILDVLPFPFNIPSIVFSFLLGKSRKKKAIGLIEILIE